MSESFEDFYRAEYVSVFRASYLASGDEDVALDATQEAFKRAFVRWPRLSREPWAGGWVMTTALNLCKRRRRRAKIQHLNEGDHAAAQDSPSADRVDLLSALRRLPLRQQQATILYYLADIPLPVIANLMGISEGTVKAHLAQARKKLRPNLEVIDA